MNVFNKLRKSSRQMDEKKDCAVKAVAIAADVDYKYAHTTLKTHGRKNRCPTPNRITRRAMRHLGFKLKKIKFKAKTIRTIERELRSDKVYLIYVRDHILAMRDGEVCDWSKGRLHRIIAVYEVMK